MSPTLREVLREAKGDPWAALGLGFYAWTLQGRRRELLELLELRRRDLEAPRRLPPAGLEPDAVLPPRPPGLERRPRRTSEKT